MFIYTFASFPDKERLHDISKEVFVFSNQLRSDMEELKQGLIEKAPEHIIGIAKSRGTSRYEPVAVNKFHHGTVIKGGPDVLHLTVPNERVGGLVTSRRSSRTFCNWTAYHVQTFISSELPDTTFSFVHLNPRDTGAFVRNILQQKSGWEHCGNINP